KSWLLSAATRVIRSSAAVSRVSGSESAMRPCYPPPGSSSQTATASQSRPGLVDGMSCVPRERHSDNLVDQATRQVAELEHATFADLRVDIHDHSVEEVARMVRAKAGNWPGLT